MFTDEKPTISYSSEKDFDTDIYSIPSSSLPSALPSQWVLSKTKKSFLKSTLHISSSGTPSHAVSTHCWHSGITIHTTSDQASEPLITAKTYLKNFHVQMPSQNLDFKTKTSWSWKKTHPRVEWDLATPDGGVEHFEWAQSYGSWKLTRRNARGEQEVVARWNFSYCSTRLSGEFEFLGSRLDETSQYVAAAVALAIGKYCRDISASNAAVLAGSSSSSASAAASAAAC